MDRQGLGFEPVRFSVPSYLCAVLAGSEFVAAAMVLLAGGGGYGISMLLATAATGLLAALMAILVFLPAALLTLRLANAWRTDRTLVYGLLSAGLSMLTSAFFLIPTDWSDHPGRNWALVVVGLVAVGGLLAGITYRWVYRLEHRKSVT